MSIRHVNGTDLFYQEQGRGTPVLLIHGTGALGDLWMIYGRRLAAHHRVIAYDRRGYGRSSGPPATNLRQHTADAAALLIALDAVPAAIVGHSLGGTIALDLALEHPELVAGLVAIEPPLPIQGLPDLAVVKLVLTMLLLRLIGLQRRAAEVFLHWVYTDTSGVSAFERLPGAAQAVAEETGAILADMGAGLPAHLAPERLAPITCPVTLLAGERTQPFLAKSVRTAAAHVPQSQLVIVPGVGHVLHVDRPDAVVTALEQMISG